MRYHMIHLHTYTVHSKFATYPQQTPFWGCGAKPQHCQTHFRLPFKTFSKASLTTLSRSKLWMREGYGTPFIYFMGIFTDLALTTRWNCFGSILALHVLVVFPGALIPICFQSPLSPHLVSIKQSRTAVYHNRSHSSASRISYC